MPWWKTLFIVTYLMIQLILPLWGFVYDDFTSRGNFTWNMYSRIYLCSSMYRLDERDGKTHWIDPDHHFNAPDGSGMVFHVEFLPRFNRWLCNKYRHEGKLGSLRGYVTCSVNNGPMWELLDPDADLCTAPNYGVRARSQAEKK